MNEIGRDFRARIAFFRAITPGTVRKSLALYATCISSLAFPSTSPGMLAYGATVSVGA